MGRTLPPRPIEARIRVWFNPQLESRDFMIPGIVALLLLVITTNLSSMAIVREKELGTLEQLNVTPVTRWQLILGKLLPYGLIGLIDVVVVSTAAVLWFEIPLLGSPWLLFGTSAIYLLTTLGLGLFISTISNTQQQAMMTATFFFLTPMLYLSGFIFPIENMPAVIQPITYLIPLRYFIVIVRGIFLKGVGVAVLVASDPGAAHVGPGDRGAGRCALAQDADLEGTRAERLAGSHWSDGYRRASNRIDIPVVQQIPEFILARRCRCVKRERARLRAVRVLPPTGFVVLLGSPTLKRPIQSNSPASRRGPADAQRASNDNRIRAGREGVRLVEDIGERMH